MNQQFGTTDSTSDDRLWTMLAYILSPIVPIIILLMPDKKDRPFIKAHNGQALVLGIVEWVINFLLSFVVIGCFTSILTLVINIWFGIRANKGEVFEIPVISNFVKQQGW
jgi:uncharacterized protein